MGINVVGFQHGPHGPAGITLYHVITTDLRITDAAILPAAVPPSFVLFELFLCPLSIRLILACVAKTRRKSRGALSVELNLEYLILAIHTDLTCSIRVQHAVRGQFIMNHLECFMLRRRYKY